MKDPAFLFYSSDFLTGVQDLTMEERGQYISLLCLHHQKGRLSEKIIKLCVGVASQDVLSKFKKDDNGLYYNSRLELESDKRKTHSVKQKERALKGWEKRKEHTSGIAPVNAAALPLENENENENEIKDVIVHENNLPKKPKFNFKKSLIDFGFENDLVVDWLAVRKNKKLTNSETAYKSLESEFLKCENELKIERNIALKFTVEKSWGGFNSDWIKNEQLKNATNGKQTTGRISNEQRLADIFTGGKYDHLIEG